MAESRPPLHVELNELLLVAIGAVPGALLRWQVAVQLQDRDVLVNVLGAAVLGLLAGLPRAPRLQLLIGIGFCGSVTTFSSWMVNAVKLITVGQPLEALGLIGITLGLGLGAAAVGFAVARRLSMPRTSQ